MLLPPSSIIQADPYVLAKKIPRNVTTLGSAFVLAEYEDEKRRGWS